jgi:hypothetical protein
MVRRDGNMLHCLANVATRGQVALLFFSVRAAAERGFG